MSCTVLQRKSGQRRGHDGRYVEVALTDGRRLFGWPLYYSNHPDEGLLYLYDAAWIDADGNYLDLDAHGILLTKKDDIAAIVFTNLEFDKATPRENIDGPRNNETAIGGKPNGQ